MVLISALSFYAAVGQQPLEGPAVLTKMVETLRSYKTVTGTLTWKIGGQSQEIKFAFAYPHFFKELRSDLDFYQSGPVRIQYMRSINQFDRSEAKVTNGRASISAPVLTGFEPMFNGDPIPYQAAPSAELVEFAGKKAYKIKLLMRQERQAMLYVDSERFIPLGAEGQIGPEDVRIYKDLLFDVPLKPVDFAWSAPKGATQYQNRNKYDDKFVKIGQQLPNFELTTPEGKKFTLMEMLKGKKGLVINFWFYG